MQQSLLASAPAIRLFSLLMFLIIGMLVAVAFVSVLMSTVGESVQSSLWMFYVSVFIQGICLFVLPTYFALIVTGAKPIPYLKLNEKTEIGKKIVFGLLTFFAVYVFVLFLTHWNRAIELPESMHVIEQWMRTKEDAAMATTQRILSVQTIGKLLMNILIIGVVAAVAEEIIFRGALQQFLHEWTRNGHVAVWVSAAIFSAVHLQFFGFFPRLVLGALLGYLFLYTRNLWVPIFVHFFNNAMILIVNYVWRDSEWLKNSEKITITLTFALLAIVSLALTVLIFRQYIKKNDTNSTYHSVERHF